MNTIDQSVLSTLEVMRAITRIQYVAFNLVRPVACSSFERDHVLVLGHTHTSGTHSGHNVILSATQICEGGLQNYYLLVSGFLRRYGRKDVTMNHK